jgi:hypothetical protein
MYYQNNYCLVKQVALISVFLLRTPVSSLTDGYQRFGGKANLKYQYNTPPDTTHFTSCIWTSLRIT